MNSIYFAQLTLLVAGGVFARDVAAVVGGASLTAWPTAVLGILTAALAPPVSQAADFWGRKWFLVVLTGFGFVGCIIVGRATSMPMAIAGYTVGGISFGAQPLLHAVVSEVIPRKYRAWAQASVNVSVSLGALFGLIIGGLLVRNNHAGFRTFSYISAGIYAASAISCAVLYHPPPRETQFGSTRHKLGQLDWVGYALLVTGIVLFSLGLSWANNPYPWDNGHVLGPFLVGCFFLGLTGIYEWKFKKDGLFHHDLFRNRNFPISLVCIFIEGMGAFAANYFIPFQISVLNPNLDSFRVALCYSISYFSFIVFAPVAGLVISWTRRVRAPSVVGFACFILFFILTAVVKVSTPEANFWGYMVFLGAGLGFLLTTLVTAAQISTPPELIAITSGLMLAIRGLGASSGLTVFNAIFNAGLSTNLASKVAEAVVPLGIAEEFVGQVLGALAAHDPDLALEIPGMTLDIFAAAAEGLQRGYQVAFAYVWASAAAFSALALIGASLFFMFVRTLFAHSVFILGTVFIRDTRDEFNANIDAPLDVVAPTGAAAEEVQIEKRAP